MRNAQPEIRNYDDLSSIDGSLNELLSILSASHRRFTLSCLREYQSPMALADIANELAIWKCDTTVTEISKDKVKSISISLYHNHLPKMEKKELIEYTDDHGLVKLTAEGKEVASAIDLPSPKHS